MEGDLPGACQLLGIRPHGALETLPASFPASTLTADLLVRTGHHRLAHVEYVTKIEQDLIARMLQYRGTIMRAHPGEHLTQHIVVLSRGRIRGYDNAARHGFSLDLAVIYLREHPPELFLNRLGLAPLATLARGNRADRERALAAAITLIRNHGADRTGELLESTAVLATIHLPRPTIRKIAEEAGMTTDNIAADIFRDTGLGQALVSQGRQEGLQAGREEGLEAGREEGLEAGRAEILTAMITALMGPGDPDEIAAVARQLASWPDQAGAVQAIQRARTVSELKAAQPAV